MIEQLKIVVLASLLTFSLAQAQVKVQSSTGATNNTYNITNTADNLTTSVSSGNMLINNRVFVSVARYSNNLGTAVSAATAKGYSVRVDTSCTITADLIIPTNVALLVERNGLVTVPTGKSLTINGPFVCGNWTAFATNIDSVFFGQNAVGGVLPEWFGAKADSSTASAAALRAAVLSQTGRRNIFLQPGVYLLNDKVVLGSNTKIIGNNSVLISSDTLDYIFNAHRKRNIWIQGVTTYYKPTKKVRAPNTSAFYLSEIDSLWLLNNRVLGAPGMGFQLVACKNLFVTGNFIKNTLADGIHITNGYNIDSSRVLWSENFVVTDNVVLDTGDDHIACVSYKRPLNASDPSFTSWTGSQEINRFGVISNNVVRGALTKYRTRGITVLGGRDIVISGNTVEGHPTVGDTSQTLVISGILVQGQTDPFKFHRPVRIKIIGNTIVKSKADHAGANFELENGGISIRGADSIDVIGNTIDWSPFIFGIYVKGDTSLRAYGYNSTPHDIRILDNTISNARIGIRIFSNFTSLSEASTRWINRVTVKGNRIYNSQRQGMTVDSVKTIFIEDNEFFNVCKFDSDSLDALLMRRYGGNVVIRNNKFQSDSTVKRVLQLYNSAALGPVVSGTHKAKILMQEDNSFDGITSTEEDVALPPLSAGVDIKGLFTYGAVDYLADTLSTTTTYRQFVEFQNRSRSTLTVNYAADSLTVQAGIYRVSGHLVVASADTGVTVILGVSQSNAAISDDALTVSQHLDKIGQFQTASYNFFISVSSLTSFKPKFKVSAGTHSLYIRRGWMTVERIN